MKKLSNYRFLGLLLLLFLSTACGKEEVEPLTVPDTLVEDTAELITPAETAAPTPTEAPTPTPTLEPTPAPEVTYAFWDQIYDLFNLATHRKNFISHGFRNPVPVGTLTLPSLPVNLYLPALQRREAFPFRGITATAQSSPD